MKKYSFIKRICGSILAGTLWIMSCLPAQAAVAATPPEYLKSVTYASDAWVINFWNTESDNMDAELAQIAADGFNSIILCIPWREFQPGTKPITYNSYAFDKLEKVMKAAENHGLWVELRVSYTWDYYEEEESRLRFREMIGDDSLRQVWLEYIEMLYETASRYPNFHGGFMTWEDFWNYMEDAKTFGTGRSSVREAKHTGYQEYLKTYYTLDQVNDYYQTQEPFTQYTDIFMPESDSPAYKLMYEFYDDYLIGLLQDAQQVFPNLSMEVRLDVDPVEGMEGGKVAAHHSRTFPCGNSTYTSAMYSVAMGQANQGEKITAATALEAMDSQLNTVKTYNGGKPIFIDQLLYTDSTQEFSHNAQIQEQELVPFITSLPPIMRKYTNGYGVWTYWNYTNNPVYNSQFALEGRGWNISRATVTERNGSNQIKIEAGGRINQKIGNRIDGKLRNSNHVRFTADSDKTAVLYVTLGGVTKEVKVNGKQQYDLDFGLVDYSTVEFRAGTELYLDNVDVYNFIQDGKLHDMENNELSCMPAIRGLNQELN